MAKITALTGLAAAQSDDVLPIVDIHDTTMAPSGTTKGITAGALFSSIPGKSAFWLPGDDGFLGFNSSPETASGGGLLIAGVAYLARLPIRTSMLVSNLWVCVTAAGVGTSSGSFCWIVSGATGAVLAQSADTVTQFTGTGWQKVPMISPVTMGGGTFPYAVILTNLLTTQPTLLRQLNTVNNSPQATAAASSLRWAGQASFGTAVGAVTLASNANNANSIIVGWS